MCQRGSGPATAAGSSRCRWPRAPSRLRWSATGSTRSMHSSASSIQTPWSVSGGSRWSSASRSSSSAARSTRQRRRPRQPKVRSSDPTYVGVPFRGARPLTSWVVTTEPPRVLVVEDDDDLRGLIHAALDDAGFAALEAADGAAALAACTERDPDVVLLDLNLPRLGGQ